MSRLGVGRAGVSLDDKIVLLGERRRRKSVRRELNWWETMAGYALWALEQGWSALGVRNGLQVGEEVGNGFVGWAWRGTVCELGR